MKKNKYLGWLILNMQLAIGFIYSYGYFHKYLIIENIFIFIVLVIVVSNLFFGLFKFIKLSSIRAFLSIMISAILCSFFIVKMTKINAIFSADDLIIISVYMIIRLLLYITTTIAIAIELFLKWKDKRQLKNNS